MYPVQVVALLEVNDTAQGRTFYGLYVHFVFGKGRFIARLRLWRTWPLHFTYCGCPVLKATHILEAFMPKLNTVGRIYKSLRAFLSLFEPIGCFIHCFWANIGQIPMQKHQGRTFLVRVSKIRKKVLGLGLKIRVVQETLYRHIDFFIFLRWNVSSVGYTKLITLEFVGELSILSGLFTRPVSPANLKWYEYDNYVIDWLWEGIQISGSMTNDWEFTRLKFWKLNILHRMKHGYMHY